MLLLGDCNFWLKEIKDESIDLIVSDPPYGIEFMGKDWDKALVSVDTWKECFRVLKNGKLAFVMCSPRQDVLSRMIINVIKNQWLVKEFIIQQIRGVIRDTLILMLGTMI
jgi:DNA modification methylase